MHGKPKQWINKEENIENSKVKIKFQQKRINVDHSPKEVRSEQEVTDRECEKRSSHGMGMEITVLTEWQNQ